MDLYILHYLKFLNNFQRQFKVKDITQILISDEIFSI